MWYWIFVGIDIVGAGIIVAFNSVTGAQCINDNWNVFRIISIVGGAALGIITTYIGIANYGGRVSAHQFAEGNYSALFNTIKRQIHEANKQQRQNGTDFIEWIEREYVSLSSNPDSPNVPEHIVKQYEEMIQGKDIAKLGEIEILDIVHSDENTEYKNASSVVLRVPSR